MPRMTDRSGGRSAAFCHSPRSHDRAVAPAVFVFLLAPSSAARPAPDAPPVNARRQQFPIRRHWRYAVSGQHDIKRRSFARSSPVVFARVSDPPGRCPAPGRWSRRKRRSLRRIRTSRRRHSLPRSRSCCKRSHSCPRRSAAAARSAPTRTCSRSSRRRTSRRWRLFGE